MLEESVSSDHDTVDGQFLTDQFLHKVRGVVDMLLDDNRAFGDGEPGPDTAWNLKTWYLFHRLENNHVITKMANHVTNQVSCLLGMDPITPQCLRSATPTEWKIVLLNPVQGDNSFLEDSSLTTITY